MACVICFDSVISVFSFYKMQSRRNMENGLTLKPLLYAGKTCISHCYCLEKEIQTTELYNSSGICKCSMART